MILLIMASQYENNTGAENIAYKLPVKVLWITYFDVTSMTIAMWVV